MSKRSELSPEDALKNIFAAFDEALCYDDDEAQNILRKAGLNPDEEVKKGLEYIKALQGKVRLRLADNKRRQVLLQAKSKLVELRQVFIGDPKERLATILAESGSVAFRKVESLTDEDALEMLEETELLKIIELVEKEVQKNKI